ncbi:MAG: bifunctional riboflavin kinase/FAD synthetase [Candidatus Hydrogenedens sp.]|jgi:riboflavin kinase/FMN adenylyltransferase|nr:bifunctional riboflavin kinase/FAD synthetase [Candidatus Hydrogenedens sp.]
MHIIADARTTSEQFSRLVLAVGCFDGVHLGHREIISALVEEAEKMKGVPAVMTLEPHPRQFFAPDTAPDILTPNPVKCRLLAELGVQVLYFLPFDAHTASLTPGQFVEEILLKRCHIKGIIAGHDFAFGKAAAGNFDFLQEAGKKHGFLARQVPPLIVQRQRISSTLIREKILQGQLDSLPSFLGRHYSICGVVQSGRGIGRTLGFPTVNLDPCDCVIPAHGVYAARVRLDKREFLSAVNIGIAPTIQHDKPMIEAHLLDFSEDIVGAEIEVIFCKRMRGEERFDSHEALIDAIARDVAVVREYFAAL